MSDPTRILIVEDSSTDADFATREIRKALTACVFEYVETREAFLTALETFRPDLVVSDYTMPHFDGMTALKLTLERAPLTPVIIWTGSLNEDTAVECMKAGATNYVLKENIKRLGPAVVHALEEKQIWVERKRAEEALRDSEARFATIFRTSPIAICLTRLADGQLVDMNDAFLSMTGYTREQALGHTTLELKMYTILEDRSRLVGLLHRQGKLSNLEVNFRRKSGEIGIGLASAELIKLGNDEFLLSLINDITERKQAEEALRDSENRLRLIVEGTQALLVSVDANGHFTYANDATARAVGYPSPEELIGKSYLHFVYPEDRQRVRDTFIHQVNTRQPSSMLEFRITDTEGKVKWFSFLSTLAIKDGQVVGESGVAQDINERKRAEEALRHNRDLLLALSRAAQAVQRVRTPAEIYSAVGEEIKALGYDLMIFALSDDREHLTIAHTTIAANLLHAAEKLTRLPTQSYRLPILRESIFGRIVAGGGAEFLHWTGDAASQVLPRALRPLAGQLVALLKVESSIAAPLRADGATLGVMTISSSMLREDDVPAMETFAAQVAISLRNARLTQQVLAELAERKRAEAEIARRVEQLVALNNAALKIQQHLDADEIYRNACDELRRFGALASVYNIDPQGQLRHVYSSMTDELLTDYVARFGNGAINFAVPVSILASAKEHLLTQTSVLNLETLRDLLEETSPEIRQLIGWLYQRVGPSPILLAPLIQDDKTIDLFAVVGNSLNEADVPAVTLFTRHVSVALENARLYAAEQARRSELTALYDLARGLVETDAPDDVFKLIVQSAVETIRVTFARIAMVEEDRLVVRATHPIRMLNRDLSAGCKEAAIRDELRRRVLARNDPVIVDANDPSLHSQVREMLFLGIGKSACLVPLHTNNAPIGILILGEQRDPDREPFNDEKQSLASAIADQATSAIRRATLRAQTEQDTIELAKAYDATIEGWSRALDLRDKETEGHTQRVTEMTMRLARQFDIAEEQLVHIRRGALLHDIGKMGIPDAILFKPDKLDDAEWKIMRSHPQYAFDLLSPIDYLQPALEIPYCHHEKWDGTGYPRGLSGEAIPITARLFAIVDVWDALTSDRPYRAAWSREQALAEIQAQVGKQFDPRVVLTFLRLVKTE